MQNVICKLIALLVLLGFPGPVFGESIKINVDDASHVSVTLDSEPVTLRNGDNTVEIRRNVWLEITSTEGWELSRVTLNNENQDFSKIYGYSKFFEDDDLIDYSSYEYVVRTKKAVDTSGDATFKISGARYIDSFIYDQYKMYTPVDGEQTFHFDNEYEADVTIYFLEEGVTATVTQNGTPVVVDKENYNKCEITLSDGDVIVINASEDVQQLSSTVEVDGLIGIIAATVSGNAFTLAEGTNYIDFGEDTSETFHLTFAPETTPAVLVNGEEATVSNRECELVLHGGETVSISTGCEYSETALNLIVDNADNLDYIQFDYVNQEFVTGFQILDVKGNTKLEMSVAARDKYQYVTLNGKELDIAYNTRGFYSAWVNPGDRLVVITDNGDRPVEPPVVKDPDGTLTLSVNDAAGITCVVKGEPVDIQDGLNEVDFYMYGMIEISPAENYTITKVLLDRVEQELTDAGGWDIYVETPEIVQNLSGKTLAVSVEKTSGIVSVTTAGQSSVDVYDMTGRLVLRNASEAELRTLDKGIYIVGGRKVAIR